MKSKYLLIFLLLIALIPLVDLFKSGLPITHDGQDHVARVANFYQNLQEGNLVPRWAANLNWGYGHPILMFLYPLPSYFASFFHFLGFSLVDSIKLVFGVSFILSIVTMFIWLRTFLSEKAAFIGGVLYGFTPYHFVDLYVRGAIGELVAFIFPPLVLYFMFKSSQKSSFWYVSGGAISLAGFILAHNAISLMFLPVIGFYATFQILHSKKRKFLIFNFSLLIFLGFALSAFFWLPAFMEGKYTLRDIVTKGSVQNNFVSLRQLFYGAWSYGVSGLFTVQVGILQWIGVFLSLVLGIRFYKKKQKEWLFVMGLLIIFFGSIFIMISLSKPIWDNITLLQKFQFPWRFLFLTMFASSVLGAFVFSTVPKKLQTTTLILCVIVILLATKDMWRAKEYLQKPESFYTQVYNGTTDTGESAPIWSIRFMEHKPKAAIEILEGQAQIKNTSRTTTQHSYTLSADEKTKLRENTLYFPGWQVLVDGKSVATEFQDPNSRGLMTFWVEKGDHEISVEFKETKLRLFADFISLGSLFALIVLGILRKKLWQN